ncbi:MAG: guanylate kinase [Bacteroidaceae bacterium]|nr:guanylate kinase [Bacteroidaceae bacterium]
MKSTILAIVGPSGSGKTTLAEHLKHELNIPVIVSYTTRPIREGEVNGKDHHFVSEQDMPPHAEMLAYTKFGDYHYWSHISQVPENGVCSYVIDEKGLLKLWENFDQDYNIVPILIKRDDSILSKTVDPERLKRDKLRVTIEDAAYKAIIVNNGTLEEFQKQAVQTIQTLI